MKKIVGSLPFKLVLGVVIGILVGQVANEGVMNVVVTIKYILNQVINFCVPLIIIGFIAPSITKLGNNASKMLGIALVLAYVSSLGAALFSMAAGYGLIPHLSIDANVEGLKELPKIVFQLDIPQIMPVMSALVFSGDMDKSKDNHDCFGGISKNCAGYRHKNCHSDSSDFYRIYFLCIVI